MDVKDAVKKAIEYIADIFKSESPNNIGLEEVILNEKENMWEITIGFSRPWDYQRMGPLIEFKPENPKRQYKIVRIDNKSGEVRSIKIREIKNE